MEKIITKNPATGEVLQEIEPTKTSDLKNVFSRARTAQQRWAALPLKKREQQLINLRECILNHLDEITDLISQENGKPKFEAMINDILPTVELLTYFGKNSHRILKDQKIRISNPILKHKQSYLNYWPVGVVAVISPWNFPFFLPIAEIAMGLVAGNAVVFKPSEVTPLVGLKIQELVDEAGFPPDILQTVVGDGKVGAAIIEERPNKVFFTGSAATGKKVMSAAAKHLIPVTLELGGKDPMVVLPDADLDYATSVALWGSFGNSGQVCASTERLILHEKIARPFLNKFKDKIAQLRHGKDNGTAKDLGFITFDKQKKIYETQIEDARDNGAEFVTGGKFSAEKNFLEPTVVTGDNIENLKIYKEETFGPVVAATTFKTIPEAVKKANDTPYGLLASVVTNNLTLGEDVARQIEAGTVTVNEVMYTGGIPETPWGGVKESGFGRKHSDAGLIEFVNVRHIHKPRWQWAQFKSMWWFPYTDYQYDTFRRFLDLYRKNWLQKLKALPLFLFNLVKFIKTEKRL